MVTEVIVKFSTVKIHISFFGMILNGITFVVHYVQKLLESDFFISQLHFL